MLNTMARVEQHSKIRNLNFSYKDRIFFEREYLDFLRLRHLVFVEKLNWNIHSQNGLEFDKFDCPNAFYVMIYLEDILGAAARLGPTLPRECSVSSMSLEILEGKIEQIPRASLKSNFINNRAWEGTRLVLNPALAPVGRGKLYRLLLRSIAEVLQAKKVSTLLTISPLRIVSATQSVGYKVNQIGAAFTCKDDEIDYSGFASRIDGVRCGSPLVFNGGQP